MDYSDTNTLIVMISTNIHKDGVQYPAEQKFLDKYVEHVNPAPDDWNYISTNGTVFLLNSLDRESSFVLYNQSKGEEFTLFVEEIKRLSRKVLVFRHNSDNCTPECSAIEATLNNSLIKCIPFSHGSDQRGTPAIVFMQKFQENGDYDYKTSFKNLICESIRNDTPHLVALSILCQGYLVVYYQEFRSNLPKGIKVSDKLQNDWWIPAFGTVTNFEATETFRELSVMNNGVSAIKDLFSKKNNDGINNEVLSAYIFLKEVLKSEEKNVY